MAPIVASVEIARSPEDVFAYVGDLSRHGEWQSSVVDVRLETEGPTRLGSRATETRRVPRGPTMKSTYEMTEWDPPRAAAFRVSNGSIRPFGRFTVEPVGDGSRSKVTLELDFTGHGLGKLMLGLVRRQASKEVPLDQARLKERLERGA